MKPINANAVPEMRQKKIPTQNFTTILKRVFSWLLALGLIFVVYKMAVMLRQPPSVEVAEIKQENVARALAITARIRPRYFNRVIPVVSGRLVKLTRAEGEAVQQGEVLAQIFDGAARAKVQQAQAAAATQREQLAQARRTYERVQKLNSTGLNSTEEVEQARLSVEQGEKVLHQLDAAIGEAETLLQDYVLRAPFSGYVLKRPVDNGQKVGTETVIYELATADQLDVEAEVDEQYLSELQLGMPATVAPLGNQRQKYETKICYIAKEVNTQTGAAIVRFCFNGAPPALSIGLSLDVNILIERHDNALVVPRVAVAGIGSAPHVFVVKNNRLERRPVQVIDWQSERIVVLSGLTAQEQVVLNTKAVQDGMEIRPRVSATAF